MMSGYRSAVWTVIATFLSHVPVARAADTPEYRLKAAFLYNFALFAEWPASVGPILNLCIVEPDPFGDEISPLQQRVVGERRIAVLRRPGAEELRDCQLVFVPRSAGTALAKILEHLHGVTVLTIAESPGAVSQGAALNMNIVNNRISFEANLAAARGANIKLSSKLLRLATAVLQ
jgi:hypothetical protein